MPDGVILGEVVREVVTLDELLCCLIEDGTNLQEALPRSLGSEPFSYVLTDATKYWV